MCSLTHISCGRQKYGFVHLSAGDMLRAERQREGSQYGELINKHIKDGSIVPVAITCALLEKVGGRPCVRLSN